MPSTAPHRGHRVGNWNSPSGVRAGITPEEEGVRRTSRQCGGQTNEWTPADRTGEGLESARNDGCFAAPAAGQGAEPAALRPS
eukprot:3526290-Pyramimonas_sp.AAC.1